jgi:queuosine precursor transporter
LFIHLGQLLWLRATGSTVISQLLDSFVVSYVAFSLGKSLTGQTPASIEEIYNIAATGYGLKFAMSLALTPALYLLRDVMENKFGLKPVPIDQEE